MSKETNETRQNTADVGDDVGDGLVAQYTSVGVGACCVGEIADCEIFAYRKSRVLPTSTNPRYHAGLSVLSPKPALFSAGVCFYYAFLSKTQNLSAPYSDAFKSW